jgi:hypothetical protein
MDMVTILSDKNCEGHTRALYHVLIREGWVDLLQIKLATFKDVDLLETASDEIVWLRCQERDCILITGNRTTTDGDDSLEMVTQRLLTESVLPVLTIGKLDKVIHDTDYRDACAESIALVIFELHKFRGIPRLFIPF